MQNLNKLELLILEKLAIEYPFIKSHIPFLKVESRETTGVGMYVNFIYDNPTHEILNLEVEDAVISTNETIEMDGLKYGLGYEVDIINGKVKFMELVTYGEEWNGVVSDNFTFTKDTSLDT